MVIKEDISNYFSLSDPKSRIAVKISRARTLVQLFYVTAPRTTTYLDGHWAGTPSATVAYIVAFCNDLDRYSGESIYSENFRRTAESHP